MAEPAPAEPAEAVKIDKVEEGIKKKVENDGNNVTKAEKNDDNDQKSKKDDANSETAANDQPTDDKTTKVIKDEVNKAANPESSDDHKDKPNEKDNKDKDEGHPDRNSVPGTPSKTTKRRATSTSSASSLLTESAGIAFIRESLESILAIKEVTKKSTEFVTAANSALKTLKSGQMPTEAAIFEPLRLACAQKNVLAKIAALDCLGKIFTFNVFNQPVFVPYAGESGQKTPVPLVEAAISEICNCFEGEGTDERVELQIIRVLMAAVMNETMPVHGRALLQAVRQIYNIFLLSLSPVNQGIAQATLIQVVNTVFDKVDEAVQIRGGSEVKGDTNKLGDDTEKPESEKSDDANKPADSTSDSKENNEESKDSDDSKATADSKNTDNTTNSDSSNSTPALPTLLSMQADVPTPQPDEALGAADQWIKDAFLVLRSMCSLAAKATASEDADMRSHGMRSKLLSLYVVYFILKNHASQLSNASCTISSHGGKVRTPFVDAIRRHICSVLSRNGSSRVGPVYEITLELFWLVLSQLRTYFKYEIPVFFTEVYFPLSQMSGASQHQRRYLMDVVRRLCADPRALVEIYLNYDCDPALPNLTEQLVDYLTRYALAEVTVTPQQRVAYRESLTRCLSTYGTKEMPELTSNRLASRAPDPEQTARYPIEYAVKMVAIEAISHLVDSLGKAGGVGAGSEGSPSQGADEAQIPDNSSTLSDLASADGSALASSSASISSAGAISAGAGTGAGATSAGTSATSIGASTTSVGTVGGRFESRKHRKTAFLHCVQLFKYSPKKGIRAFVNNHFLTDDQPATVARFIYETSALDKAAVGEYLGGGHDANIATMHAFVDRMDFHDLEFLPALRGFLQHFRLPGESQKIDRFMLKFAEKYVSDNPGVFANADTVYVLSYSVVMLNTDLHSPQVKQRMTVEEFIKNNRGIDDGHDLAPELLRGIYRDIDSDEIILESERADAALKGAEASAGTSTGIASASQFGLFGARAAAREAYVQASKQMADKTEKAVTSLRKGARSEFYQLESSATGVSPVPEHVKSMLQTLWMSILAGLTAPFREYDDPDTAKTLLCGMKACVRLACVFALDDMRTAFMRALVQFTSINSPQALSQKNIQAIYAILDTAHADCDDLKDSWRCVFIVISQVERLRLLSRGVDSGVVPDLLNARLAERSSVDSKGARASTARARTSFALFGRRVSESEEAARRHQAERLAPEQAAQLNSHEMDVAIDQVFVRSAQISGDGIFDFVAGLSEVAREEIESSSGSTQPRMFSLQKLVDVCYYNMGRIRVQWSALWSVLNETFSEFGCHNNQAVASFAVDSLRQMAERFFDIEELAHFKFQKDFLLPFDYIITHNNSLAVRDMVLDCVHYLVAKKASKIRSGWATLLQVLTNAAVDDDEKFVAKGYRYVAGICHEHFDEVFAQDGFSALVICLTEYAKNDKFQKVSLRALRDIDSFIAVVDSRTHKIHNKDEPDFISYDALADLWFPLLYGFHDVIMEGEDLEVRAQALDDLFTTLVKYGDQFGPKFWYRVSEELLFPIFGILSQHWQLSTNQEDLWVWLSSTLIQALRRMISLFTTFYATLSGMLDGYLKLLVSCICQENETISRVGISCLEDMLLQNAAKFGKEEWEKIDSTFETLFKLTRATELFEVAGEASAGSTNAVSTPSETDEAGAGEAGENAGADNSADDNAADGNTPDDSASADSDTGSAISDTSSASAVRALKVSQAKSTIVIKCVLQLHMIQTVSELFDNEKFCEAIPVEDMLKLAGLVYASYEFARDFNENYDLRVKLWNSGVMSKLPNLLKQETSAVGVYISIAFRLYCDEKKAGGDTKQAIAKRLVPLSVGLVTRYVEFDAKEQARSVQSWTPIVVEAIQACTEMDTKDFAQVRKDLYKSILRLFDRPLGPGLRLAMQGFFERSGDDDDDK